jgi:hypothetical protein
MQSNAILSCTFIRFFNESLQRTDQIQPNQTNKENKENKENNENKENKENKEKTKLNTSH